MDGKSPILDYSRPLSPEKRESAAAELLDSDGPLAQYVKLFPTTEEAAVFYGRYYSRRFSRENVDRICKECGVATERVVVIRSNAFFMKRLLEFSVDTAGYQILIETHHSLCERCLAAVTRRIRAHDRAIRRALLLFCFAFVYLVWSGYDPGWARFLKERMGLWFFAPPVALILTSVVLVVLRQRLADRKVPRALRQTFAGGHVTIEDGGSV